MHYLRREAFTRRSQSFQYLRANPPVLGQFKAQSWQVPGTIQKIHPLKSCEGKQCCSYGFFFWPLSKQSSGGACKLQCSQRDFYCTMFVERDFLLYQPISFGADANTVVTEKSFHTTGIYYVLETSDVRPWIFLSSWFTLL